MSDPGNILQIYGYGDTKPFINVVKIGGMQGPTYIELSLDKFKDRSSLLLIPSEAETLAKMLLYRAAEVKVAETKHEQAQS